MFKLSLKSVMKQTLKRASRLEVFLLFKMVESLQDYLLLCFTNFGQEIQETEDISMHYIDKSNMELIWMSLLNPKPSNFKTDCI